jgi:hypothetical protein
LAVLAILALGLAAAYRLWPDFWVWRAVADLWPAATSILNLSPASEQIRPQGAGEGPPASSQAEPPAAAGEPAVAVASGSLAGAEPAGEKAAPEAAKAEAPALGGELTLVSQKDEIWLQLIVDGQPVKHYWLKRGQMIVQRAEKSVVVRTGQGTALTATWNGLDMGALSAQPVVEASFPPG